MEAPPWRLHYIRPPTDEAPDRRAMRATPAYQRFEAFQTRFEYLQETLRRDIGRAIDPNALENVTDDRDLSLSHYAADEFDRVVSAIEFAEEWMCVMLVTATEAYLHDGLAYCAGLDPELMADSEQRARYHDVTTAESIDELAEDMRRAWPRNFVDDGGPPRWIDRLQRMGAKGYGTGLAQQLNVVWGIRHLIVHTAGAVTTDFSRRHGTSRGKRDEHVQIDANDLLHFQTVIRHFVEPTEAFFVRRFLAAEDGDA